MKELQMLRGFVAAVKSANPLLKTAPAERALDAVVACLANIEKRLQQLEERAVKHGE